MSKDGLPSFLNETEQRLVDYQSNDEWFAYDPETKSMRALTQDELFDLSAKAEATAPRVATVPPEAAAVPVVTPPAATTAARLTQ